MKKSLIVLAVFAALNATAMFNPSATQDAQFETLAKYIPAVSTAAGRRMVDPDNVDNCDLNGADYRSGWGRPQSEGEQPWFHSDMKNMSYLFINSLYNDIVTNGGLR